MGKLKLLSCQVSNSCGENILFGGHGTLFPLLLSVSLNVNRDWSKLTPVAVPNELTPAWLQYN
jgi:hypothetical protein